ncbi:MAG: hypothetical protein KDC46_04850 [Thermoleophilia bacterium]|nr:hypothetical protein [Thermoleophilia bacterium]
MTELDAETLRAELDLRWPDAEGQGRATTDERHRLVLVHPEYDGFVSLTVRARADVDGVFVVPEPALDAIVTSHHRTGPLLRGQELPIDLELHPGNVARRGSDGMLRLVDASGEDVAPPVRLTVATDSSLDCVLAGAVDGPWDDDQQFEAAVEELLSGRGSARRMALRIDAITAGKPDPGWGRSLPWRRR